MTTDEAIATVAGGNKMIDALTEERDELREVVKLAVSAYEDPSIWLDQAREALDKYAPKVPEHAS